MAQVLKITIGEEGENNPKQKQLELTQYDLKTDEGLTLALQNVREMFRKLENTIIHDPELGNRMIPGTYDKRPYYERPKWTNGN